MKITFSDQITRWRIKNQKRRQKGFTLLELLVAVLIGGIITSGLLFLVVELLRVDLREETLTQVQQDMRRALDYINSDLSEAVYVYADPEPVTNQLTDLPTDAEPIVAFWRFDPLSAQDIVDLGDCSTKGAKEEECDTLKVRQAYYTLVVYLHQSNNDPNDIWEGQARIIRYSLPKYVGNVANLNPRSGYADPTLPIAGSDPERFNSFQDWEKGSGDTEGLKPTLVDFVALPNSVDNNCDVDKNGVPDQPDLSQPFPATSDSFYVCTRSGATATATVQTNQSVIIYLRGDAEAGSAAVNSSVSENSRFPTLETEVFIRGVLEKLPE